MKSKQQSKNQAGRQTIAKRAKQRIFKPLFRQEVRQAESEKHIIIGNLGMKLNNLVEGKFMNE